MDQALVAALRGDLLRRQLGAVQEAFGIALAQRDMAGGVFIEQGVEEQKKRKINWKKIEKLFLDHEILLFDVNV